MLHRRRHRPRGGDNVRIGEVLEQQIPVPRVRVVKGFEAARDEARRHCGGNLIVERDLLAARVPRTAGVVGVPGLEDDGARRARRQRPRTSGAAGECARAPWRVRSPPPRHCRHDHLRARRKRRSAAVRCSALAAPGRDSVILADLQDNLHEQPRAPTDRPRSAGRGWRRPLVAIDERSSTAEPRARVRHRRTARWPSECL